MTHTCWRYADAPILSDPTRPLHINRHSPLRRQTTPRNTRLCDETALLDGLEDEVCTMFAER